MANFDYDNLYVAVSVYEHEVETKAWRDRENTGTLEHRIIINPKKRLIYSDVDRDGYETFYDYKTGNVVEEYIYLSSFISESSPTQSIYTAYINGSAKYFDPELKKALKKRFKEKRKYVGYFIPFEKYVQEKLGLDIDFLPPALADKIIRLMNVSAGKSFMLSFDADEARKQLEKIGYHKKSKKK